MPSETRPGTRPQRAHRQVTYRLLPQTRDNWRRLEAKAKRLSRKLARQKRGSGRRARTRARLAKTRRRQAGTRRDWHHQVSRRIAEGAHTVAIENLKVKAMTASARGTAEEPGSGVKQKAGLNRVVLDTGWAALRAMLEYKAGRVIAVDPRHTSQTCAACGHVDARSRRTRDRFHCVACGHADHADANAARTIQRRGLALLHGEAAGPWNREHTSKDGGMSRPPFYVSPKP